jgi:hypothetical protein
VACAVLVAAWGMITVTVMAVVWWQSGGERVAEALVGSFEAQT